MVGGGAAAAGTPKPRIVIIGAGMAGLSAAYHMRAACFDVTLLEASPRIGGRIQTSTFDGDRVELGATWIHGIEGSPLFDLANLIAASHNDNSENPPWERQDGFPPPPLFKAEGGLSVSPSLIRPVMQLYDHTLCRIRDRATAASTKLANGDVSIGDYVRQQWSAYITCGDSAASGWSVRSLQEAALDSKEYMERIATSANSLYDLDLLSEKEYEEYPGEHVTIARGYESLVEELSRCLPPTTAILFGKKAVKILWEKSPVVEIQCEDGSSFFADHLIITVSLGVLKAACTTTTTSITTNNNNNNSNNPLSDNKAICRSVHELPSLKPVKIDPWQLFEPQLPLSKLESISRLGFGVVDKLFLLLDPSSPYGDELRHNHWQLLYKKQQGKESVNGSTAVPWWMRKTFSISPIYNGSNVALCWFAGEEAMELESLSDEEIIEGVFNTLKEFGLIRATSAKSSDGTGEAAVEMCSANELIKGVVRSSWARNLLFQGSYSYVATGANGLDIEALAEPLPKSSSKTAEEEEDSRSPFPLQVLFAGEATERNFYSTTHGAFLSGKREALRLLNHYGLAM